MSSLKLEGFASVAMTEVGGRVGCGAVVEGPVVVGAAVTTVDVVGVTVDVEVTRLVGC